ncbi:5'-3' exonuclease [Metabacillus malikii]|uniref:5'-3' exonuclease n=1 Tax=Metabacillus malikii TaxID=1504265 RepID=A0ABT9Z995_9BACI|nr:5'-3' exonuclease [Metabacillus malikii]MDQ0228827.1 5'-3' exonuclease [Metabacillus malikii]
MGKENHLLIVDGMALLFRSFFATSVYGHYMVNSKGIPTNAVNGLLKHLFAAIEYVKPSHVVVCWDMGSKTYRNELFQEYKSNRPEAPLEMQPQFQLAKEAITALDIPNIGLEGYEADDCIGTLTKKFADETKMTIITGDRDILQLLNDQVDVLIFQKGIGNYKHYKQNVFVEEFGIDPQMLIDVKALMGDSSDNYPGVKGIGEKTAYKLIGQYKSIQSLLENLTELTKGQKAKIENDLEMLHLSRQLAEINCKVPVECSLHEMKLSIDEEKAFSMIQDYELKGIRNLLSNITNVKEAM